MDRNAIQKRMADRALARFGLDVFVNGVQFRASLVDEEFTDETGPVKELSLGFVPEQAVTLRAGDLVIINSNEYRIKRVPEEQTDDILLRVDLARA